MTPRTIAMYGIQIVVCTYGPLHLLAGDVHELSRMR